MKIGVIGFGYWGPNIVRTFVEIPETSVEAVADLDPERLERARARYPQIPHLTEDYHQLLQMDLDAIVVSTPPETHFEIVSRCLQQGHDVLVEKPLATNTAAALRLAELAKMTGRILMVGHIGAYNPAVRALKEMVDSGEVGDVRYIDAVRVGLGAFHPSLNVIWDLAPHDVAVLTYVIGEKPVSVSTHGIACIQDSVEDVAYVTLRFPSGVLAHLRLSWLDPRKTRQVTVVGSKKMVVYDDLESHEKLKVYDKRVDAIRKTETFGDFQFAYHYGSVVSPYIHFDEPLRVECLHFVECLMTRQRPLTDGRDGADVVRIIEAAQRSLRSGGVEVSIESDVDRVLDLSEPPAALAAQVASQ